MADMTIDEAAADTTVTGVEKFPASDGGTANSDWRKGQLFYQGDWQGDALALNWQAGMSRKAYGANTFYGAGGKRRGEFR